jgi:hypothetical protein
MDYTKIFMVEARQTQEFRAGCTVSGMPMRSRALSAAFAAWRWEMPAMLEASVTASSKCASTMGRVTGFYHVHRGAQIVILLCRGDKRTQRRDIKRAQKLAETL